MNVGENICRIRKERQIPQNVLAESVGISQAMMCQIEKGIKNPSLQVGKEIADVLGCSIEKLLE